MTDQLPSDDIKTSLANQVLSVQLNRPEKKNALTHDMYTQLTTIFREAETNPDVRVLFLTGTKDTFTAGNDLSDFLNNPPKSLDSPVFKFLEILSKFSKPLIAAATGSAIGLGTTLFLHCDLVYLGKSAKLKLPFVNLGLCPEAASSLLLPALAGHQRASQAILLGELINAEQAENWGLANAVFDDDAYQERAYEKALLLAKQPAASVRLSKQLLKQSQQLLVAERLSLEADHFNKRLTSPEAKEAFTAFFEKRPADFSSFD